MDREKIGEPKIRDYLTIVKLEQIRGCVPEIVKFIRNLTDEHCRDSDYIEHNVIPMCGLSDDPWWDTPEISQPHGKVLHLLQLPCQVVPLLAWLSDNPCGIESYLEIGVRWGDTFILITEWLRRFSPSLRQSVALEPAKCFLSSGIMLTSSVTQVKMTNLKCVMSGNSLRLSSRLT